MHTVLYVLIKWFSPAPNKRRGGETILMFWYAPSQKWRTWPSFFPFDLKGKTGPGACISSERRTVVFFVVFWEGIVRNEGVTLAHVPRPPPLPFLRGNGTSTYPKREQTPYVRKGKLIRIRRRRRKHMVYPGQIYHFDNYMPSCQ